MSSSRLFSVPAVALAACLALLAGLLVQVTSATSAEAAPPVGEQWVSQTSPADMGFLSVVWGGPSGDKKFVAIANAGPGENRVATSPDGVVWTPQTTPTDVSWHFVTWGGPVGNELFVAVAYLGDGNRIMTSPDGVEWDSRPAPVDVEWVSVTWGGPTGQEKFVAVAMTGATHRVMTSPDGLEWDVQESPITQGWRSVVWGGPTGDKKFVAVSGGGTGDRVMTSPDGIEWEPQDPAPAANNDWTWVTWGGPSGNQKFVAVSSNGTDRVMTSQDGEEWTPVAAGGSSAWWTVGWGGPPGQETFVAVAYSGVSNQIMTSPDGVNWQGRAAPVNNGWRAITWGGPPGAQMFVAVAAAGGSTNRIMTTTLAPQIDSVEVTGTARVGSQLTAQVSGVSGVPVPTTTWQWKRSDNGTSGWTNIDGATNAAYTPVSGDVDKYLRAEATATNVAEAVSQESSATARIRESVAPVGDQWVSQTTTSDTSLLDVVWGGPAGNELFVAVSQSGENRVLTSPDGVTWTPRDAAANISWHAVTWGGSPGNEKFVAVAWGGAGQRVMTSPDGIEWDLASGTVPNQTWVDVTWGDGKFVAVSTNGTQRVMTSTDGENWTTKATPGGINFEWRSVVWGGDKFVAVSGNNPDSDERVMTSTDGDTWVPQDAASRNAWYSVTWGGPAGNKKFVAVATSGSGNRVMTSEDGEEWESGTSAADNAWWSVAWGGPAGQEKFVAVSGGPGVGNRVMTSTNGETWASQTSAADNTWRSVAWGGPSGRQVFAAVSDAGASNQVMTTTVAPDVSSVVVTGTARVGVELAAQANGVTGVPMPTTTWQWQRSDDGASGWENISNADAATYTPVSADEGKYLRAVVTATNVVEEFSERSDSTGPVLEPLPSGSVSAVFDDPILTFDSVPQSPQNQFTTVTSRMTVTDDRLLGVDPDRLGWSVSIDSTALTSPGKPDIPANNIDVHQVEDLQRVSGDPISNDPMDQAGPYIADASASLNSAFFWAFAGFGHGIYTAEVTIGLDVPAMAEPGDYSGTITVTTILDLPAP